MHKRIIGRKRYLCVAVSMAIAAGQVVAQGDGALVLEEVVVTAQKTVQLLQDVPVTVNAITGDTFQSTVSFDMQDLGKLTPGLHLIATGNNQNVTLRGVGTGIQASQSPRTNIYFDGSYVSNQQLSFFSQFDVARFEVLRGPQGTLYSKTSPTGTIIVHTNNPDLFEVEGFVQTTVGQHDLFNTEFGISIPLIEGEMGLRIAGIYDENNSNDQFYETLSKDVLSRTRGGRATLVWSPTGPFDGRLSHTYLDVSSNVARFVGETADISRYDRKILDDIERDQNIRINQTILELNWDMDWATLSSQSFYAESTNGENYLDQDSSPVDEGTQGTDINFSKLFNTELRLASSGNDFWDWIVGVYYAHTNSRTDVVNTDYTLRDLGFGAWLLNDTVTDVTLHSGSEDWGIFTHNTFYLSDDFSLTVGARWSDERRQSSTATSGALNFDPAIPLPPPAPPGSVLAQAPYDLGTVHSPTRYIDWTGTIKLAYELDADQMLYFTYDRGGRSGGQTLDLQGTTPRDLLEFAPESSNSFELGYKSDLMDGRMRLNASVYYQVYKDFHVQAFDVPIGQAGQLATFDVIVNAKEAISQGAELDVTYLFTERLRAGLSVAYNDTKFEDFDNAPCDNGSGVLANGEFATCNLNGQRVGGDSGNWAVVANSHYSLPIAAIGSEWYVDGLLNFNSFRIAPDTRRRSASYTTVDLFTGLRSLENTWDIKLWVKNVFDKEASINDNYNETMLTNRSLNFQPVAPGQIMEYGSGVTPHEQLVRPRQVGVTGTYRF